jgi:hypothetical protein
MAKAKRQTHEERDALFVQMPGEWPWWPMLPMKRVNGSSLGEYGFLLEKKTPPFVVYLGNMYDLPRDAKSWDEALAGWSTEVHPTVESLLHRWRVD